jgi:predicted HTH transcriptional regulator
LIAFSKEGANLLVSKDRLTDNETLLLWLLAYHVGFSLGFVSESDCVSKEELQAKLGKSGKIASTRLGELVKSDMIVKSADDKYRITTFGVVQMQKDVIPKIKAKVNS